MDNQREIWKDCKGYEGRYQVSNLGRVYSLISHRFLTIQLHPTGYYRVLLTAEDGKKHNEAVHRLVAFAFIPNPDNLPQVNHKDENKTNNIPDNLEWVEAKKNCNYGTRNSRIASARCKKINQYTLAGEFVATYNSAKEAAEITGIGATNIRKCADGYGKTAGGYIWKFEKMKG